MNKIINAILLVVLVGLVLYALVESPAGCQGKAAGEGELRAVEMKIGQRDFTLEVADTPAARQRGLMHRKSMPEDRGMIFVFPGEAVRDFWMRNTHIPLDIIFVNAERKVVSIEQMKPYDERGASSGKPAKYAIELNKGMAEKAGVKVGDVVEIPAGARETDR